MQENIDIVNKIIDKYNVSNEERKAFWNIIRPIFEHKEFQKRMDASLYPHHDTVSLGDHIINDAILSYVLASKKLPEIDVSLTVIIAMFHDLYELPWQNSNLKKEMYVNNHAFVHPLEAIINAINWFPEYFEDLNKAKIIIDGVIHHMWPFPVRAIDDDIETLELNNKFKWDLVSEDLKKEIIYSTLRNYIKKLHLSYTRSEFLEGRIMSKADKKVSLIKDISLKGCLSVMTGKNSNLDIFKR